MGINEVAIHEQVANTQLRNLLSQKWPQLVHWLRKPQPLLPGETEFVQGQAQLVNLNPLAFEVASETRKKTAKRAHQQQHRALDQQLSLWVTALGHALHSISLKC